MFQQNIGAFIMRFSKTVEGSMCPSCVESAFWECTLTTLFLGWWGITSFLLTPIFLIANLFVYTRVSRRGPAVAGLALLGLLGLIGGILWWSSTPTRLPVRAGGEALPPSEPRSPGEIRAYLRDHPNGPFAARARERWRELAAGGAAAVRSLEATSDRDAAAFARILADLASTGPEASLRVTFEGTSEAGRGSNALVLPGKPTILLDPVFGPAHLREIEDRAFRSLEEALAGALGSPLVSCVRGAPDPNGASLRIEYRIVPTDSVIVPASTTRVRVGGEETERRIAEVTGIRIEAMIRLSVPGEPSRESLLKAEGEPARDALAGTLLIGIRLPKFEYGRLADSAFEALFRSVGRRFGRP